MQKGFGGRRLICLDIAGGGAFAADVTVKEGEQKNYVGGDTSCGLHNDENSTFSNAGRVDFFSKNSCGLYNEGTVINQIGGTMMVIGEGGRGAINYNKVINFGTVTINGGLSNGFLNVSNGNPGIYIGTGTFINDTKGILIVNGGSGSSSYGFDNHAAFSNKVGGTTVATGGSGNAAYGFFHRSNLTLNNSGILNTTGGSGKEAYGFLNGNSFTNEAEGTVNAIGGSGNKAYGFSNKSAFNNRGTVTASSNSVNTNYGFYNYQYFTNEAGGTVNTTGGSISSSYGFYNIGIFENDSGSTVNTTGGLISLSHGFYNYGTFKNKSGGTVTVTGGSTTSSYGFYNTRSFWNEGTVNLIATKALNAYRGKINQSEADSVIAGNTLAFVASDLISAVDVFGTLFDASASFLEVKELASFLTNLITGGTIYITDSDLSITAQTKLKEAIYSTGVASDVTITFAGTGERSVGQKVVNITHAQTLITAGYEGAVLYEDTMDAVSGGLTIGGSSSAMGSLGFKSIASDAVTITDGKALTLLGDGTQLAGTAGKVTVNNGELKLGFIHDVTKDTAQGGELSTVSLADAGKLSVADVNGTYRISDRLSLADKATLTNAGKLSVASVAFAGNNATVTNTGTTVVKTASGSGKGNTLKNAGIYSQTDLSAFGDVQNKGTLKTGTLTVGAADKLVNGGTILAEKITVDGLLQNRNGTFALGTAAVAKYLEKHLDLAQQLKDLGETLPASVEKLLTSQTSLSESASAPAVSEDEKTSSTEADAESTVFRDLEKTDGIDFASWLAALQAANAPQGRLATREGRLAFAGLSTYADNQAQLERQLQSGVSGLWADVIASQSEMDGYKANRSGIAVGLQGSNDAGVTFGVAARYSDGKLKGDTLASENWMSAGGSAYAAWDNDDAFVSGLVGYDNLKTKGSDKLTNDVVSAGVKSGLKLDVGPVHVTPFVGGEVVHQKVKGLNAATTYRFPMGVGVSGQYETYGAWQVHPSLEVAFVPLAGDKVVDMTDKVDSRFAGNYAFESRLGIAVEKKNLMLGINYHGAAGDAGLRSHSLQANVKYRF